MISIAGSPSVDLQWQRYIDWIWPTTWQPNRAFPVDPARFDCVLQGLVIESKLRMYMLLILILGLEVDGVF